jgi:putative phosphoribosyl transferase
MKTALNIEIGRREVQIPIESTFLEAESVVPADARGLVIFVHGSGSGRLSPRNQFVARGFQKRGLATLLFDLLTPAEERQDSITGELRFDIQFLADRLVKVVDWIATEDAAGLGIGLFGSSTGAAAALVAATKVRNEVAALVSRGGRPDLAGSALAEVRAPTLLIVGECDNAVLNLNRKALIELQCEKELKIVAGATHLFEEPGALEQAAFLAGVWFQHHFRIPVTNYGGRNYEN